MKISAKRTADPYVVSDIHVAELDGIVINKNSAAAGISPPVYAAGATEVILVKDLKLILNTPLTASRQITTAEIKSGNTSPILLVSPPGANYALLPISMHVKYNYVSAAFNGATKKVGLITDTGTVNHFISDSAILGATSNKFETCHWGTAGSPEIVENKGLYVKTTEDHTAGDGNIYVYVVYQIIRL
jgi:hypothetical protein